MRTKEGAGPKVRRPLLGDVSGHRGLRGQRLPAESPAEVLSTVQERPSCVPSRLLDVTGAAAAPTAWTGTSFWAAATPPAAPSLLQATLAVPLALLPEPLIRPIDLWLTVLPPLPSPAWPPSAPVAESP